MHSKVDLTFLLIPMSLYLKKEEQTQLYDNSN